jgi:hypothetical protein
VPYFATAFRRIAACGAGTALCLTLATSTGQPVARAEARELLASAIANTQGSYLVYNFGGGHPAPMLNAAGNWYDGGSGGHLMIIKAASQRLSRICWWTAITATSRAVNVTRMRAPATG